MKRRLFDDSEYVLTNNTVRTFFIYGFELLLSVCFLMFNALAFLFSLNDRGRK